MTIRAISSATTDHAKLQLVLTGFATELGHLRAYAERANQTGSAAAPDEFTSLQSLNEAIGTAMDKAVKLTRLAAYDGSAQASPDGSGTAK